MLSGCCLSLLQLLILLLLLFVGSVCNFSVEMSSSRRKSARSRFFEENVFGNEESTAAVVSCDENLDMGCKSKQGKQKICVSTDVGTDSIDNLTVMFGSLKISSDIYQSVGCSSAELELGKRKRCMMSQGREKRFVGFDYVADTSRDGVRKVSRSHKSKKTTAAAGGFGAETVGNYNDGSVSFSYGGQQLYQRKRKGEDQRSSLKWFAQQRVPVGAARGLRYLHEECRVGCIVHHDLRPNNILLTHDFEPLVGDLKLAKWQPDGDIGMQTRVIGIFGYLAPEYAQSEEITEKTDVYSFGVVLVELR